MLLSKIEIKQLARETRGYYYQQEGEVIYKVSREGKTEAREEFLEMWREYYRKTWGDIFEV